MQRHADIFSISTTAVLLKEVSEALLPIFPIGSGFDIC